MNPKITTAKSLLSGIVRIVNMINTALDRHHEQVAYLSFMIAREIGFSQKEYKNLIYAGLLHDIGSIMFDDFESQTSIADIEKEAQKLSLYSSRLVFGFLDADDISKIILHSQSPWKESNKDDINAILGNIIHLSDYVVMMVNDDKSILNQAKEIIHMIQSLSSEFKSDVLNAFLKTSTKEYVWMDIKYNPEFLTFFIDDLGDIDIDEAINITRFIARLIDYRSSFTVMHSAGVAASAYALAELSNMSELNQKKILISGYLHDIGKLRVPKSILEKPGKLDEAEFNIIKEHPYYTRLILMGIEGFEDIANWASFHHEKLNGKGYPFCLEGKDLDYGSRLLAVADIFSALTESRPYRKEMKKEKVIDILLDAVNKNELDKDIVQLLIDHFEYVDNKRFQASLTEGKRYYDEINLE